MIKTIMDTAFFKITDTENQRDEIEKAAAFIRAGEVVAMPTETVYGLAANAFDPKAVEKIFEAKGRPQDNPLIVHIADAEEIYKIAEDVPQTAIALFEKFAPGPLTVILKKKDVIPDAVSAGLPTVAIRQPSHPVAQALIRAAGVPLAAPSANISGFPSPTNAIDVYDDMNGRISAILDGGSCDFGIESTVVTLAADPPRLLRPGVITVEELQSVLGDVDVDEAVLNPLKKGETAASPGMKYKHYAPKAKIYIVEGDFETYLAYLKAHKDEADYALVFEEEASRTPLPTVTMGSISDPFSQTKRLFDALRELDKKGAKTVFARSPSKEGVGLGICNRLYRAAGFHFLNENIARGKILGVCGLSGAGKSHVCRILEEKGAVILDTDRIAREITLPGSPVLKTLAENFGRDILHTDGSLNRRLLASRAFGSREKSERLSAITHPEIIKITLERAKEIIKDGKTAVIDAPLLFSAGLDKLCDQTIKVFAPEEVRLRRIISRDDVSEEEAKKRMSAQNEEDKLSEKADIIIKNYPPYDPLDQINKLHLL